MTARLGRQTGAMLALSLLFVACETDRLELLDFDFAEGQPFALI